jgi:hypothetical protein
MNHVATNLNPAAQRARRCRERKRSGARCLQIEIPGEDIDGFVRLGVLPNERRSEADALQAAVATLCRAGSRTLREARDGDVNALPKRAIDLLVLHGFLPPSQRQDAAALATAVEKLAVTFNAVSTRWDISAIWRVNPSNA